MNINYSLSLSLSCSLTISSRVKNCIVLSMTKNDWGKKFKWPISNGSIPIIMLQHAVFSFGSLKSVLHIQA